MPSGDHRNVLLGLLFLFLGLYVGLSLATHTPLDPPSSASGVVSNWGGTLGSHLAYYLWTGLGWMSPVVVLALLVCSGQCFLDRDDMVQWRVLGSWLVVLLSGTALLGQVRVLSGGIVGGYLLDRVEPVVGVVGAALIFSFFLLLGLSYRVGNHIRETFLLAGRWLAVAGDWLLTAGSRTFDASGTAREWLAETIPSSWFPSWVGSGPSIVRPSNGEETEPTNRSSSPSGNVRTSSVSPEEPRGNQPAGGTAPPDVESNGAEPSETSGPALGENESSGEEEPVASGSGPSDGTSESSRTPVEDGSSQQAELIDTSRGDPEPVEVKHSRPEVDDVDPSAYDMPFLDILTPGNLDEAQPSDDRLQTLSDKLEETFDEFNIDARVVRVNPGPVLTTYEVEPGPGVSVKKIESRADDIKLSLAVESVRIVSPIPGKSAVGIEVPNPDRALVTLRDVLGTEAFQTKNDGLSLGLGLSVLGEPLVVNLADLPHLLVAGATGSGKSVCLNGIISSLLFQHDPWELKMIMVDPKRVELKLYDGLPHLMTPVIDDPSDATKVLKWAVEEMERRYKVLSEAGKRDIRSYNEDRASEDRMPYLVVIVDELADLMFTNPKECEQSIQRLAQMARAVGIHMVLATQRPSTDVITGIIKANMPARIAFRVSSGTDSRVILGQNGAETLLGDGDLLYFSSDAPQPRRAQGAFVKDEETKDLIRFVKEQLRPSYVDEDDLFQSSTTPLVEEDFNDEYYEQAKQLVVREDKGSASMIQRQFRVGYNRAARMLDMMEEEGIVGPHRGSKAREVLVSQDDLDSDAS